MPRTPLTPLLLLTLGATLAACSPVAGDWEGTCELEDGNTLDIDLDLRPGGEQQGEFDLWARGPERASVSWEGVLLGHSEGDHLLVSLLPEGGDLNRGYVTTVYLELWREGDALVGECQYGGFRDVWPEEDPTFRGALLDLFEAVVEEFGEALAEAMTGVDPSVQTGVPSARYGPVTFTRR